MKTLYENSKNETCFSCDATINSGECLLYRIFELRFQGTRICLNGSFYIQKIECLSDILLGPVAASQRPSGLGWEFMSIQIRAHCLTKYLK
ncbi:unnamed protein product [Citrullus colocynthis]|uniref:Uncharacterized protein n=1 Tax=Citrullus colocynthis TaxID=252529 RepID=A0ABP0YND6_9ROSI